MRDVLSLFGLTRGKSAKKIKVWDGGANHSRMAGYLPYDIGGFKVPNWGLVPGKKNRF